MSDTRAINTLIRVLRTTPETRPEIMALAAEVERELQEKLSGISLVDEGRLEELKTLVLVADEHVSRYNGRDQYWNGRRDEAGWFRDKLNAILKVL